MIMGQIDIGHTGTMTLGEFEDVPGWTRPAELGDAFAARLPIDLVVVDHPREGYVTRIRYAWRPGDRIGVESIYVGLTTGAVPDVTGDLLRELRVAEHTRDNVPRLVTRYGKPAIPDKSVIAERVAAGPRSPHTLWLVQTLYRFAEITGLPPAKFIQDVMDLKPATAGRWIRRSKESLDWGDRAKGRGGNDGEG